MALYFTSIQVVAWVDRGWRISWRLVGVNDTMVHRIDRAESAMGPWVQVGETPWNQPWFEDEIYTRAFSKRYFWRIRVVTPGVDPAPDVRHIETHPFGLESERSRILSEAIRQHEYRLRPFNGRLANLSRRFAVYKRTSWVAHCAYCVDLETGEAFKDYCPECLGSRKVTGWTLPHTFTAYFTQPFSKSTEHGMYGKSQLRSNVLRLANWPIIEEEDIIVEKLSNAHYKVLRSSATEPSGVIVSQNVEVQQIPYDAVEMRLPYPEGQD